VSAPSKWPVSTAAFAATLGLCAVAAAISMSGTDSEFAWLEATVRALTVGIPITVGIYARRHPPFERFGTLLVATGCGWFLTTLSGSPNEVFYSVGRVSGWLVDAALVYVILAFPSGRLARPDRILVVAVAVVVGLLYLPTALLVESYPAPSVYMSCDADCPANAFMLVSAEPAFVENVIRPFRELLTAVIFAAATLRLLWRMEQATHLMRRLLAPVVIVAGARMLALAVAFAARAIDEYSTFTQATLWLIALGVPALACGFLVGLVRWRLFSAAAMERLATGLRAHPRPEDLRGALADAFEDPSLEVLYRIGERSGGRWADADGRTVDRDVLARGRSVTEVLDGDRPVAAIVHDPALEGDHAFIESATSYAVMTFDNHRLTVQTAALLQEISESRARIQAAADDERRRIEADLHDGAQQRLVALRIKLELAAERLADGNGHTAMLQGLGQEVEEALDELRSLARGIYPAPLGRGLTEALQSAALQSALTTTVHATRVGRYSRELETAAYFCCLEAMQNAAKHARGATGIAIELFDNGNTLLFEVRDNGAGFDRVAVDRGMGLTSMHDRIAAVGGELEIDSRPGRGTRVTVTIPLPASARDPAGVPA
jgi:signal transduction histidine kinase